MITFSIDKPDARVTMRARKTMDGNIMIYDHPEINIVISPSSGKVFSLPKTQYGDHIYAVQSRLFDHLARKGVVDGASVYGGNIFGSLEGKLLVVEENQKENVDAVQVAIYSVAKFLQNEAPLYNKYREYEEDMEKDLVDPPDDETTPLGKIPHEPRQGTVNTYPGSQAAYGLVGYQYEE
jgi:hypothetical protein